MKDEITLPEVTINGVKLLPNEIHHRELNSSPYADRSFIIPDRKGLYRVCNPSQNFIVVGIGGPDKLLAIAPACGPAMSFLEYMNE